MHDRPLVAVKKDPVVNEDGRERGRRVDEKRRMTSRLIRWSRRNYSATTFAIVLLALLELNVEPYQRIGFFCNDPKISFKFVGDTISNFLMVTFSICLPLLVTWIVEYVFYPAESYESAYYGTRCKQIWRWYGHYVAGMLTLTLVCEIMKVLVGEPRPHFLDTCKPREAVNCTDEYFSSYTCTNTESSYWYVNDSNKSFPSGHSALSVYTSIFLVWYLQNRLPSRTLFLKPWLQCLMGIWAVTCSLTRVGDRRHHWWDVFVGDVLGFLFGLFVATISCRHFRPKPSVASAAATHVLNEPLENGRIGGYSMQHNTKEPLNPAVVDVSEGREMKDVTTWRE